MSYQTRINKNAFFTARDEQLFPNGDDRRFEFFSERRGAAKSQGRGKSKGRTDELPEKTNTLGAKPPQICIPDKNSMALLNEYKEPEFDSMKLMEIQDKIMKENLMTGLTTNLTTNASDNQLKAANLLSREMSSPREPKKGPVLAKKPLGKKLVLPGKKEASAERAVSKKDSSVGRSVSKQSSTRQKSTSQSKQPVASSSTSRTMNKPTEMAGYFRSAIPQFKEYNKSPINGVVKQKQTQGSKDFLAGIKKLTTSTANHPGNSHSVSYNNQTEKKLVKPASSIPKTTENSKEKKPKVLAGSEVNGLKKRLFEGQSIDGLLTKNIKPSALEGSSTNKKTAATKTASNLR
jgi:hypothetical protein